MRDLVHAFGDGVAGTGRLLAEVDPLLLAVRCSAARGVTGPAESADDRAVHLAGQQPAGQASVGEIHVGQRQFDAQRRVVAQCADLGDGCSGGGQRIPFPAGHVVVVVLDRVQQVCHPAEQLPDLTQRRLVVRAPGQHRGVSERRGDGRLGGLGDQQHRAARTRGRLELGLPVHRGDQHTVSNPRLWPASVPWRTHRSAMRRAAGRTPSAPTMPSRSSTWSRTRAAASASDTTAASRRTVTRRHIRAPHLAQRAPPGVPPARLPFGLRFDQQGNH